MSRGRKLCNKCGEANGPRSFKCKSCNHPFKMNVNKKIKITKTKRFKRPKKRVINNWTELERGDIIRVVGGSGPYYKDENSEKHYLTNRGLYTVLKSEQNGIHVRSDKGGDFQFLYMGPTKKSDLCTNLYRAAHKLVTVPSKSKGYNNEYF